MTGRRPTARRGLRAAVFRFLRLSGLPWLLRETIQRGRATIILYHDPSAGTLEKHVRALSVRYRVISLLDLVSTLADGSGALPRKPLAITFDDGYAGNAALVEIFRRYGVRPTFFVCTGLIGTNRGYWFRHTSDVETLKRVSDDERLARLVVDGFDPDGALPVREAMSEEELGLLSTVADIQAHTVSHPILTKCAPARARKEIEESKRQLEQRFGLDVYALAYPNGDHSDEVVSLVREAGYHCALAVGGDTNPRDVDLYRIQRIAIDDNDGVDELLVKASGLWRRLHRPRGGNE